MPNAYQDQSVADLVAQYRKDVLGQESRVEKTLLGWQVFVESKPSEVADAKKSNLKFTKKSAKPKIQYGDEDLVTLELSLIKITQKFHVFLVNGKEKWILSSDVLGFNSVNYGPPTFTFLGNYAVKKGLLP